MESHIQNEPSPSEVEWRRTDADGIWRDAELHKWLTQNWIDSTVQWIGVELGDIILNFKEILHRNGWCKLLVEEAGERVLGANWIF